MVLKFLLLALVGLCHGADAPANIPGTDVKPGQTYYSPDGSRMIKIRGERNEAFLYMRYKGEEPELLTVLDRDVVRVQFSPAKTEDKLQILLTLKDGSFAMFDAKGRRYAVAPSGGNLVK